MNTTDKNILVVDDDRIILDSLCEFLSLEGFQTSGAETFKSAVAELQKQIYSLVITDVSLPDGDGFDLLDVVRKDYPRTVVIVITGYGTIERAVKDRDTNKTYCCGMLSFLYVC